MVTVNAAAALNGAGSFATSRRGGVSHAEIAEARGKLGSRATASQIAKYTGRCEADIRPMMDDPAAAAFDAMAKVRKAEAKARADRIAANYRKAEDAEFAKRWAAKVSMNELKALYRCGEYAIRKRVVRLGLQPRPAGRRSRVDWNDTLDSLLLREYIHKGEEAQAVAKLIPGATACAVIGRAHRLGYTRGTVDRLAA